MGESDLPDRAERERLVIWLADLVDACGYEWFVRAPLIEPTERDFPDEWHPSAEGVAILAQRLFAYAGLTDLEAVVERFEDDAPQKGLLGLGLEMRVEHSGAAAWFAGIEGKRCYFGVNESQLGDADGVVAAMAHEVAHAFRRVNELEVEDRDLEEKLTDLTTVYLGFGVLTTNAAYRYRASGDWKSTQWSHQKLGYLGPLAMAFLLAAHARTRRTTAAEARRIEKLLEPTQADAFRAAFDMLATDELDARLEIPDESEWPAPIERKRAVTIAMAMPERWNAGREVPRLRRSLAGPLCMAGVVVGIGLVPLLDRLDIGNGAVWLAAVLGTPLVAFFAGDSFVRVTCGDPRCGARIPRHAEECPRCGGVRLLPPRMRVEDTGEDARASSDTRVS